MGVIKNVLLTGGTGYLGSALAKYFIKQGLNVFVLKRASSKLDKLNDVINQLTTIDAETVNYRQFFTDNEIDAVVHTAATYGRKGESFTEVFKTNVLFSVELLDNAILSGVKYFFNTNTSLPAELNNYAFSKRQFAEILKFKSKEINIIDIELQYFYAPLDDASKFVSYIISQLRDGVPQIDLSPCAQIRDFIYIDDVLSAFYKLMEHVGSLPNYTIVPLGSGEGISLKELTCLIKETYNDNNNTLLNFGAFPMRENDVTYSVADITLLKKLGWEPLTNLHNGLNKTITIEKSQFYDTDRG